MQASGTLQTAILAVLVLFVLYRRLRRTVGRQRVTPKRFFVRAGLLGIGGCAILALLLAAAVGPLPLIEALLGLGAGAGAAAYGLRLTRFERTPDGDVYFTPNLYVGLAVYALFLARLVYRFVFRAFASSNPAQFAPSGAPTVGSSPGIQQAFDPVTTMILFIFLGYYILYYLGVLRRSRELMTGVRD